MSDLGVGLSLALSIPLQLMGLAAVKSFATLENAAVRAASRIKGSTHETAEQIAAFTNQLGRRMPLPQDELAAGIEELVKVGGNLQWSMRAVEVAAKFAVAGGGSLNEMIGRLTGTMFAFNMTTGDAQKDLMALGHVGDVIAFSADQTKASYTGLTDSFEKAAPVAKALGISFEDTAAMLSTMSQAMIEGGRAGTQFQMIGRDLTIAFEKHKEVWKSIGVDVFDPVTHSLRSMPQIIGEVQVALSKLNPEAGVNLLGDLGLPSRSRHAVLAMFGLTDQAKQLRAELGHVGGYVSGVFNAQMDSFSSQMAVMRNRLTEVQYVAGNALVPVLKTLNAGFKSLLDSFLAMAPIQQQHVMEWLILAGTLPLVLLVMGPVLRTMEALVLVGWRVIATLVTTTTQLVIYAVRIGFAAAAWLAYSVARAVAWAAEVGGLIGIVAAIAVMGLLAYAIYKAAEALYNWAGGWDGIKDKLKSWGKDVLTMLEEVGKGMEGYMGTALDKVNAKMDEMMDNFKKKHPEMNFAVSGGLPGLGGGAMTGPSGLAPQMKMDLGDEDFTTAGKEKGSSTAHQFTAREFGTVEEYKARVTGQAELSKATDKLLAEHKKSNVHLKKAGDDLGAIKKKFLSQNKPDIEEANLT